MSLYGYCGLYIVYRKPSVSKCPPSAQDCFCDMLLTPNDPQEPDSDLNVHTERIRLNPPRRCVLKLQFCVESPAKDLCSESPLTAPKNSNNYDLQSTWIVGYGFSLDCKSLISTGYRSVVLTRGNLESARSAK